MKKLNAKGFSIVEGILIFVIVGIIGFVGWYVWNNRNDETDTSNSTTTITNFQQCKDAGNPVQESFPEKCTANGQTYTNDVPDENKVTSLVDANGLVNCHDKFTLKISKDWYSYYLDNGYEQCTVSNLQLQDLPPVGNAATNDIYFVFNTEKIGSKSLDKWVEEYSDKNIVNSEYPSKILDKESTKLDNGQEAFLIYTSGGHYNTKTTHFFYKKGDLGIATAWSTDSKLTDEALTALKTIN